MTRRPSEARQRAIREGYRSGLEERLAAYLEAQGIPVVYEDPASVIRYTVPARRTRYTPDFVLPNGIRIETKGRFQACDRTKHRLIKAEHPDLDIRFIFSNPNTRISKTSKVTYAQWCEDHGFLYAKAPTPTQAAKGAPFVPPEGLAEPPKETS